jgi:hypothetical protein
MSIGVGRHVEYMGENRSPNKVLIAKHGGNKEAGRS